MEQMKFLVISLLLLVSLHAGAQFRFVSSKQKNYTGEYHDKFVFHLKLGRYSDTLFLNDSRILGSVIEHGELTQNNKPEFYVLFSELIDTTRARTPGNFNQDEQYIFYLNDRETKVEKVLYKSLTKGMLWYYKK